jgi:hypothetical protein
MTKLIDQRVLTIHGKMSLIKTTMDTETKLADSLVLSLKSLDTSHLLASPSSKKSQKNKK